MFRLSITMFVCCLCACPLVATEPELCKEIEPFRWMLGDWKLVDGKNGDKKVEKEIGFRFQGKLSVVPGRGGKSLEFGYSYFCAVDSTTYAVIGKDVLDPFDLAPDGYNLSFKGRAEVLEGEAVGLVHNFHGWLSLDSKEIKSEWQIIRGDEELLRRPILFSTKSGTVSDSVEPTVLTFRRLERD